MSHDPLPPGAVIGIIGGGQLARMLAMAAARLGYRIVVLEPQADCPAAQVANVHIQAAYDDKAALDRLAGMADVVTYEFENVPASAAQHLSSVATLHPNARALAVSQDRLTEKRFLNEAGIATARFTKVDSDADLADALVEFGGNGVLKTRRLGYDGKGQRVFRNASAPAGVFAAMGSVPLILEELVPFEREISIIAARSQDGKVIAYDPAENVHREGILHTSTVPSRMSSALSRKAADYVGSLLAALDYVGVVGLELFVGPGERLLANEFAPRVHNSGHWTQAACVVSQFEQHIRAIAGLPLGNGVRHSNAVMENLIGPYQSRIAGLAGEPNVSIELYGKAEAKPGRKMGHFTRVTPLAH